MTCVLRALRVCFCGIFFAACAPSAAVDGSLPVVDGAADAPIDHETTVDASDAAAVGDASWDALDAAPCSGHGTLHNDHCDCDAGYRSAGTECVAIEPCAADDNNEPNDTVATATRLIVDTPLVGRLCADEVDYFVVSAPMGQRLVVDLRFRHAEGDLELWLFEPGRDPRFDRAIARSESSDDDEQVAHRTRIGGDFIAVVTRGSSGAQASYSLSATLVP